MRDSACIAEDTLDKALEVSMYQLQTLYEVVAVDIEMNACTVSTTNRGSVRLGLLIVIVLLHLLLRSGLIASLDCQS